MKKSACLVLSILGCLPSEPATTFTSISVGSVSGPTGTDGATSTTVGASVGASTSAGDSAEDPCDEYVSCIAQADGDLTTGLADCIALHGPLEDSCKAQMCETKYRKWWSADVTACGEPEDCELLSLDGVQCELGCWFTHEICVASIGACLSEDGDPSACIDVLDRCLEECPYL